MLQVDESALDGIRAQLSRRVCHLRQVSLRDGLGDGTVVQGSRDARHSHATVANSPWNDNGEILPCMLRFLQYDLRFLWSEQGNQI